MVPGSNQGNDNKDAEKRQEILQSLMQDPYFQSVAKRVRKQTTTIPQTWRGARKAIQTNQPPVTQPAPQADSASGTAAPASKPGQDTRSVTQRHVPPQVAKHTGTRKIVIQQVSDGHALDEIVDQLSQAPAATTEPPKVKITRPMQQMIRPGAGNSPAETRPTTGEHEEEYMDIPDKMENSSYMAIPDEKELEPGKQSGKPTTKPLPLPIPPRPAVIAANAPASERPVTSRRQIIVAQGSLEATLAGLDGMTQKTADGQEAASWMVNTMENASTEMLDNLVNSLQKGAQDISSLNKVSQQNAGMSVSQDIQEYAQQIGVSGEDLYNAMHEESIESLDQLYQAFQEMGMPGGVQTPSFEIFVSGLVHSYRDRKNEVALLGLIGVNPTTGQQHLSTTYARLLAELFRPEIGGYFLQDTKNPNYNCFNLGNMIQHCLLELEEMPRVSYLENLLTLLKERDQLLLVGRQIIETSLKDAYFLKLFSDRDRIIALLEKYFADLAIFQLGLIGHEELPDDITRAAPRDIYQFLRFVSGFPKNLIQKNSKVIYMLQRLYENDPMLFHLLS